MEPLNSTELVFRSASQLAASIRAREISPVAVAEAFLRRIAEINPALNAIVTIAPDVMDQAQEAERAIQRGEAGRPFPGVPLTFKSTIYHSGIPPTRGLLLRARPIAKLP